MNPLKTSQDLAFYPFKVLLEVWAIFECYVLCVLNLYCTQVWINSVYPDPVWTSELYNCSFDSSGRGPVPAALDTRSRETLHLNPFLYNQVALSDPSFN